MTKREFLRRLHNALPKEDIEERAAFYAEIIDDRMEEGLSEEEAVETIAAQVFGEAVAIMPTETATEKKHLGIGTIVLLVLGSPIWLSLLIAALAVVLALYVTLWAVIVSLWAAFAAIIGGAIGVAFGGVAAFLDGNVLGGTAMIGATVVCVGLAMFWILACKAATKGAAWLTKAVFRIRAKGETR